MSKRSYSNNNGGGKRRKNGYVSAYKPKSKSKVYQSSGEKKFFDTDVDDATITAAMTINNLTVIPEENGESDRVGRKITITDIYWKYIIRLPGATAVISTSDVVKLMLVQDTQTNGAAFTALNLLDTDVWESFRNLSNGKRFNVLFSEDIRVVAHSGSGRGTTDTLAFGEDRTFAVGSRKVKIPIEYDNSATTGVITSVRSNNIYWVTQSLDGICIGVGTVRLRYTDR